MDDIAGLISYWVFDKKGELKDIKREEDKPRAKELYNIAKETLRYAPDVLTQGEKLRRVAFLNEDSEWVITLTPKQDITVMQKVHSIENV